MPTTISFCFPLGRYHATPWNKAVNENEVEWPPSPWRILRALISTWHLRWPDLPETEVDQVLTALATRPSYRTPVADRAHTRHYMPDLSHRSGQPSTDLVLDPFLWMDPAEPVLVRWDVDLDEEQRSTLGKLCELMPYLGRSESVVRAELLANSPDLDDGWWVPDQECGRPVRLLAPTAEAGRADLEITTTQVRKARSTVPPKTAFVAYARPGQIEPPVLQNQRAGVGAIRWQVQSRAPFRTEYGILATERLRHTRLAMVAQHVGEPPPQLAGKGPTATEEPPGALQRDHAHAHWLWLPRDGVITDLVLWMPNGDLDPATANAMLGWPELGLVEGGWSPRGWVRTEVYVSGLGEVGAVLGGLVGPSRRWVCATPYLPVRHRKRNQQAEDWIRKDIEKECSYRGQPAPVSVTPNPDQTAAMQKYRRYRWKENMKDRRAGAWLSLTFDEPVSGPLVLGGLSHFGFGLFVPSGE